MVHQDRMISIIDGAALNSVAQDESSEEPSRIAVCAQGRHEAHGSRQRAEFGRYRDAYSAFLKSKKASAGTRMPASSTTALSKSDNLVMSKHLALPNPKSHLSLTPH